MPQPSSSLTTLRPDLGGSFEEFDLEMQRAGYIGTQILPIFETQQKSGTFGKIPIEQLLTIGEVKRSPGGKYNRGDWDFDEDSFACKEYGWEEPVDDTEAAMYAEYFDVEMITTRRALEIVMGAAERRIAAAIFNATTFTPTSVNNEWDDATNATPIDDVEARVQAIYTATGIWPNTLVITNKVFRNLRNCQQVIDRIASSGAGSATKPGDITKAMLAQVFDLEKIMVGNASKNTAKEGQAASVGPIWDDEYAWVGKTATGNDIREACIGRTFHWDADGSMAEGRVETYRDETVRSDIVRVRHDVHEKLIYTTVGQLLDNITS